MVPQTLMSETMTCWQTIGTIILLVTSAGWLVIGRKYIWRWISTASGALERFLTEGYR